MIARPTAASAAATAITKNTKICPATPSRSAKATKARFTAFSISSTHMKITIALRRSSTPIVPIAKRAAEIPSVAPVNMLELPFREHDRADHRRRQQQARDLEGNEVGVEQRPGDGPDDPLMYDHRVERARREDDRVGRGGAERGTKVEQEHEPENRPDRRRHESLQVAARAPEVEQ